MNIHKDGTMIWFNSSGKIQNIEIYSVVTETWIDLNLKETSFQMRDLLEKSQILVNEWLASHPGELEPDGAA